MTVTRKKIQVTLVGSFKQNPAALKLLFDFLNKNYTLLSPKSISWVNPKEDFVKAEGEQTAGSDEIEDRHLEAIRNSDFVVLHAPKGYVGISGAFEVGYAQALGIPVLFDSAPSDPMLRSILDQHIDTLEDGDYPTPDSGQGIKALQQYYRRTAQRRGWDKESARDTMLLMTEEIGELARAVRKQEGLKRDHQYTTDLAEELADVQLYLLHLASIQGIDLGEAVTAKEIKNEQRFKTKNTP
jgi:NTP pyrophosphatase (non-canonical NTP hydrolase)